MVSQTLSKNRVDFMESYKLLELSGSESDTGNDIVHFASYEHSPAVPHPRKKRLKRKERDLLRSAGSVHQEHPSRCTSWSPCCLNEFTRTSCCEPPLQLGRQTCGNRWEFLRTCFLVVIIISLAIVTWFAIHLHARLDNTQSIVDKIEASGSELPAKFHESHVRLQQLEKNHTSLWTALSSVSSDVKELTEKMKILETSLKALEDRLSGTPKLSSLPKTVADVEASVATFGSSLQDVQSSLKSLKEGHDTLNKNAQITKDSVDGLKLDVLQLKNDTQLPPERGREGAADKRGDSVASAILSLRGHVEDLSSSLVAINSSIASSLKGRQSDADKVQTFETLFNESLWNISHKVSELEVVCKKLEEENLPSQMGNLSLDLSNMKQISYDQHKQILNLNESIAVVKGVEKKLEGSQLQMASGVSELKQQLQKLESTFGSLMTSTTQSSRQSGERERGRISRSIIEDSIEAGTERKLT